MRRARLFPVPVLLVAVLLFACTPVPPGPRIVSPADKTQAPGNGQVSVVVARDGAPRSSLLVELVTGSGGTRRVRDITARLAESGDSLTTTLGPADLVEGVSEVRLGQRQAGGGVRPLGSARFSWEPSIDATTAGRCDVLDASRCLLPFPNDHFTGGRRRQRHRPAASHLDAASMPSNAVGQRPSTRPSGTATTASAPGSLILTVVPGVDLGATGAAPITDIGRVARRRPAPSCCSTPTPASAIRSGPSSTPTPTGPTTGRC